MSRASKRVRVAARGNHPRGLPPRGNDRPKWGLTEKGHMARSPLLPGGPGIGASECGPTPPHPNALHRHGQSPEATHPPTQARRHAQSQVTTPQATHFLRRLRLPSFPLPSSTKPNQLVRSRPHRHATRRAPPASSNLSSPRAIRSPEIDRPDPSPARRRPTPAHLGSIRRPPGGSERGLHRGGPRCPASRSLRRRRRHEPAGTRRSCQPWTPPRARPSSSTTAQGNSRPDRSLHPLSLSLFLTSSLSCLRPDLTTSLQVAGASILLYQRAIPPCGRLVLAELSAMIPRLAPLKWDVPVPGGMGVRIPGINGAVVVWFVVGSHSRCTLWRHRFGEDNGLHLVVLSVVQSG